MTIRFCFFIVMLMSTVGFGQQLLYELPPNLPAPVPMGTGLNRYLTVEQGKAVLDLTLAQSPNLKAWQARTEWNRKHIQQGAGLDPWPKRNALNPIVHGKRMFDGYTVENVAFETIPGFYTTGNLYRPVNPTGPSPIVVSTHGHGNITNPDQAPRFTESMQHRCATLARMGAVVFSIDMLGYGDTAAQVTSAAHRTPLAMPIQIWGAMRAIDFLTSFDDVDPKRIAITGESGGGTQAFVVTSLDPRITVSVPVVMVSSSMFGGCPCESGRPIHRSAEHFVTNAEIAAMAAPRPMLVVSDGRDWTQDVPRIEFPFIQKIYQLNDVEKNVRNAHFPDEGHDYGPSKRKAAYAFLAEQFMLDLAKADESKVTVEPAIAMRVWNDANPLPANALKSAAAVEAALKAAQQ